MLIYDENFIQLKSLSDSLQFVIDTLGTNIYITLVLSQEGRNPSYEALKHHSIEAKKNIDELIKQIEKDNKDRQK